MNKIIAITGGSKGLGLEIINQLCKINDYKIATIARNVDDLDYHFLLQIKGDITINKDRKRFVNAILDKWDKIDVLINNAGMLGEFKPLETYTEKEVNELINLNIKGTFMMTQLVIQSMMLGGFIVNIGSTRSITGAPNKSLYSMSKFALRGLTQCINAEYKDKGIYSTLVCPGSFKTVSIKEVAKIILNLIELPIESHVPEIIIGGKI